MTGISKAINGMLESGRDGYVWATYSKVVRRDTAPCLVESRSYYGVQGGKVSRHSLDPESREWKVESLN